MNFKTIVRITRAPFFIALIVPVLVGAALAWTEGSFHLGYLVLSLIGIMLTNAGLNMSNDYFDHLSGTDEVNQELTPFSGGSRTIQEGLLSPKQVLAWSTGFIVAAVAIGLYLVFARGLGLLWVGLVGVFIAVFNSAPPFRLSYRGYGLAELVTFLGCGPLPALGSYYVQTGGFTWEAVWASIPTGLLGAAIIWINELPDYEADKHAGKRTAVVLLGRGRGVWGYVALVAASYAVIVAAVLLQVFPITLLIALLTAPLAIKAIRLALKYHSDTPNLIPASATTIQLYLATGVALCLGYIVDGLL
jgi:1,4-dihydroxy-2-naphthoate octaprenyltransferase